MKSVDDAAKNLSAVFSRKTYTPEQAAHAIPFILVAGADGIAASSLPDVLADMLGKLRHALGMKPGVKGEPLAQAMAAYFRIYPVHPALLAELSAAVDGDWRVAAAAMCALARTPQFAGWLPLTSTPSKQRVKGGPLARNSLSKKR